jgi:hypothetical protein
MLITFKSSAAADVLMYKTHAKPLLDSLKKELDQGVITAEEMPAAIATLENEIAQSKRMPAASDQDQDQADLNDNEEDFDSGKKVSFGARAFPLLEMMRAASKEQTFVMWGV